MEGVAATHHDAVGLFDSFHLVVEMMHGSEVLQTKFCAEHISHLWFVGIVTLGINHTPDVDAREGHEDDAALLINMVLHAEQLDLGRGPRQIILTEIGRIADQ